MDLMGTSFFDLEESNLQSSIFTAGGIGLNIEDHPGYNENGSKINEHALSFLSDDDNTDEDKDIENQGLSTLHYSEVVGKCRDLVKKFKVIQPK